MKKSQKEIPRRCVPPMMYKEGFTILTDRQRDYFKRRYPKGHSILAWFYVVWKTPADGRTGEERCRLQHKKSRFYKLRKTLYKDGILTAKDLKLGIGGRRITV